MRGRLDRERIRDLFGKLSEKLEKRGVRAHIYLVGGAMMTLTWNESRTTWDIDGRIDRGHREVTEAVLEIAREENLPGTWLNEQNTPYMPTGDDPEARRVFESASLVVTGASPRRLLAMKLEKGRLGDQPDIAVLVRLLGIGSVREALALHREVYGGGRVNKKTRLFLEELAAKAGGPDEEK